MICGIDPGLSGGIAFLNNNSLEVLPMPISTLVIANKKTRYINILNLCNIFIARNTLNSCIIEKQQSMPNQGLSSTFKTGLGYGILFTTAITLILVPVIFRILADIRPKYQEAGERIDESESIWV